MPVCLGVAWHTHSLLPFASVESTAVVIRGNRDDLRFSHRLQNHAPWHPSLHNRRTLQLK